MQSLADLPISQVEKLAISINSLLGKEDPAPGESYRMVVEVRGGAVDFGTVSRIGPKKK